MACGGARTEEYRLVSFVSAEDNEIGRTGTLWSGVAHIITAVVGSGVLTLAWSTAQLGWIGGPLCLLLFGAVTLFQSFLIADCYRSPDPEYGPHRNRTYMDAVKSYLGEKQKWVCALLQYLGMYGTGVAYTIATASSIRAIARSNCYHREGSAAHCENEDRSSMLIFGLVQIALSQIPGFHNMAWLSIIASAMSIFYSTISFALSLSTVLENGTIKGSIGGVAEATAEEKLWRIAQALGDIAFAYPFSSVLLEIQERNIGPCFLLNPCSPRDIFSLTYRNDTLKAPPQENRTMKRACVISISITTFFYICCGASGYAAFGSATPGNLLTGISFYEPYWLVDFANACVVIHLVGAYQVYSQPVFGFVERMLGESLFDSAEFFGVNAVKVSIRAAYVALTTGSAMVVPYFNEVVAVTGALFFWPIAVYLPVEMSLVQRKTRAWTGRWLVLRGFSLVLLLVSIVAIVGSLHGLFSPALS